jgi:hypothetical protein
MSKVHGSEYAVPYRTGRKIRVVGAILYSSFTFLVEKEEWRDRPVEQLHRTGGKRRS